MNKYCRLNVEAGINVISFLLPQNEVSKTRQDRFHTKEQDERIQQCIKVSPAQEGSTGGAHEGCCEEYCEN